MAPNDAAGVTKEAPGPGAECGREPAAADAHRDPPMLRLYGFLLMLLGATAIIGAYAAPVSLPRLFLALVIWLVGCLSLFMARD